MSIPNKASRLLLRAVTVLLLLGSAFVGEPRAQTIFSDDFNRPDGTVGNGWSSWWDGAFDHPNIAIANGELVTRGFPNQAGGVFRTLPVTFPAAFAFDFRTPLTVADNQCSALLYNEGGWLITFNAATPAFTPPYPPFNPAQLMFYQYAGSRNVGRSYHTPGGVVFDSAPDLPEPVAGQRDFRASPAARVEGVVNADLSATITIHYNDGQTPDPVVFAFGPANNPVSSPPGSVFVLSNSSCNNGQQIFDNLTLSVPQVETVVSIDIKPGSYPNSINLGSNGTVPVAILSSPGFDAATVDPLTVTLSGARVRLRGKGTPMASLEDVNGDGFKDLLLHVSTEALDLSPSDTQAVLKGKTFGGAAFTGSDSVRLVP